MNLQFTYQDFLTAISPEEVINPTPNVEINSVAYDSRKLLPNSTALFFALNGGNRSGVSFLTDAYKKGVRIFVIPSTANIDYLSDATYLIVEDTLKALQRLAKFHRANFMIPIVAITGSLGKTTIKEWSYHLLKQHFNLSCLFLK